MIKELYQSAEPQSLQPCFVPASSASVGTFNTKCKAMIITATKWNELLSNASKARIRPQTTIASNGRLVTQNEAEFKRYLKNESQVMTRQWENTVQNIRDKKESDRLRKQQEKVEEDKKLYHALKTADEIKRNELIEKAQEIIQREKEGPRVLESAAKFCEVLKAREFQCKFKSDQKIQIDKRRKELDKQDNTLSNQLIKSQAERYIEERRRFDCYKNELRDQIQRDEIDKQQKRNSLIEQERKQREVLEDKIKRQIEREQQVFERKKAMRRQHALEAMKMTQEREERLKREMIIEDSLNEIYNDGQMVISNKRKEIHTNKHKLRDNAELLQEEVERRKQLLDDEDKNREKALQEKEKMAEKNIREKIETEKQMKAARIQAHLDEMNCKKVKASEQEAMEHKEMANRLKNVDVTFGFNQRNATNIANRTQIQRKLLLDQIDERRTHENIESDTKAELQYMRNSAKKENRHFMKYAEELITDNKRKGRPVLPLLRSVENYKREHYLDYREKEFTPRHLISNVPINNKLADQEYINDPAIIEMTPAMPPIRVRYDPKQLKDMDPYKNHKI
ncbi:calponin homology domain-containing protein DDB_G0272472-like [Malaya genurostris]|uniref:calponin homology domain-containing protein DDB_G0272472-like n=1 Tax=Malaya genurostris TaxID=325434 RepID=UPI0026F3F03A|nr:calponin homology domain-containing protein DDB_G0272472-like [Malaya genurostris]